MSEQKIKLRKVKVHNLQDVDLTLSRNELVVFTGVSGSGKSSLAFDTLYTEGQRRYIESLSTFARRQMGEMSKPDMESATGITPTISIEQKTAGKNPRSSVGTMTEVYDYLRVLYARVGTPHCPVSGEAVLPQSREKIIRTVQSLPYSSKIIILSPFAKGKKGEFKEDFQELLRKGYTRVRIDGRMVHLGDEITLDKTVSHDVDVVIDRLVVNEENKSRIAEAITNALQFSDGICSVSSGDEEKLYSMHAYSPKSGISYTSLEPHDFSFNSPAGMCESCHGLGKVTAYDLEKVIDPDKSIAEDCCSIASSYSTVRYGNIYDNLARIYSFSVHTPWKKLSPKAKEIFLNGVDQKWIRMQFVHPVSGAQWTDFVKWRGVLNEALYRYQEAKSEGYRKRAEKLMNEEVCPKCRGERLKPYPAATLLHGKRIAQLTWMTVAECADFFQKLELTPQELLIAEELLKEIKERLSFLMQVGLHYLTLDRTAPTLSGGEAQRVRLASQIGCGLVGITYVLDEPSIGLHHRDNKKLISTLKHLRDMGNTVIVVEHDEETIWEADRIVDFGPGPGHLGGKILVNGDHKKLIACKESKTAAYLTGKMEIPIPKIRRKPTNEAIEIVGASHHNLKNLDINIPLGLFLAVTGVSGSGKSSLISETLYPALANHLHHAEHPVGPYKEIKGMDLVDKVIAIDQSPIGRNPRSNPSTYIKVFDEIRDLFSMLPESQARGFLPGRFSFNVKEGTCSQCSGMGMIKIDMDFLEDAWVECPLCKGYRFDAETLSVTYKGKSIYDVLEMEIADALEFFQNIPSIQHKLETLQKVGLGYIKLGQSSTTLSGGEAQRVKLAKELSRPATGKTLYILDEPTTGLHFHDIQYLLHVLHELVERGNTVLVIEHNMEIVKTADWVIDLGPEGGAGGGKVIATGTPETIAKSKTPSGIAVYEMLHRDPQANLKAAFERDALRKKEPDKSVNQITVKGAEQNNLKHLDLTIPRGKLTVCTGPSGSGKTSLAFDTIYAEGQRRYIESLSPYARQFVKQMPKPKVQRVEGLSPAIAIEQKSHAGNPRSTVGTMTEIYDFLRVLYARIGIPHSPDTGEIIKSISKEYVVNRVLGYPDGEKIQILAPIEVRKNEKFSHILARLQRLGYVRVRFNGTYFTLDQEELLQAYDPKRKNELSLVIDRLKVKPDMRNRLMEAISKAEEIGDKKLFIVREEEGDIFFNLAFAVESTGKSYPEITPHTFAFNTPEGMCHECQGLGYQYGANLLQDEEVKRMTPMKLIKLLWGDHLTKHAYAQFVLFAEEEGIDIRSPIQKLPAEKVHLLLNGSEEEKWYDTGKGYRFKWIGIHNVLAKMGRNAKSWLKESIIPMLHEVTCFSCEGSRINPLARAVTIDDLSISDLCALPIEKSLAFIETLQFPKEEEKILKEVQRQLLSRLLFLQEVGLHYIALDRKAPSLSGGEAQRIRLARQLGSGLTGVLYVLDEPTIGLHPRDSDRLNRALKKLKDLGNTLIMVEHDAATIATADYIMDFGPHAGIHGGHITEQGTLSKIKKSKKSLTGAYLSGREKIPVPKKRRSLDKGSLSISNAEEHNLKSLSVEIPIGAFTCVTGVSGSGKSTLILDVLKPAVEKGLWEQDTVHLKGKGTVSGIEHFEKLISIDQNPIGHTVRSDVSTYSEILTPMREFFASLPLARTKGLMPRHFSYNHRKGMCSNCWGLGYKKVYMHFLPPIKVVCDQCNGLRLNPTSLEVTYQDKNLGQYLNMTVEEIRNAFQNHPRIVRRCDTLISVGLGYLKLGQEMVSLSGGEAQRIKLSRELSKRSSGKTLYLMDEPTIGLHSDDLQKLLKVLHRLTDKGNTLVVIEHNLDLIKNADYLIDLGPEAGEDGGEIVTTGTPEQIRNSKNSYTAKYLNEII